MGENGRETGVVKWFNDKKGYGFISRDSGDDVFVHHSSIVAEGFRSLAEGDRVEFSITQENKGQAAVEVRKI
ncbi:MAG: cold shock domain-containing protein [Syntrophales bacterium]|jgi:cold shock protein|nr:cold shock domain-containing protein [Syntrophales bacterium]